LPKGIFVLNPIKKSFAYGDHTVTIEPARSPARRHGAVMVNMDDTVVLATVVAALNPSPARISFR
jgi:polyribonucleotide nucleotidyltransferase